jgi:hypothetical protein
VSDRRSGTLAVAVVLAACVLLAGGCGQATKTAPLDGAGLLAERCTRCHPQTRVDDARHDRPGWEATVARMRSKGAQLSDAEAAVVVDYLVGRQVP